MLCSQSKGAQFGGLVLPTAVQAILFDLMNGGEKDWLTEPLEQRPPYWDLGRDAALAASQDFALARPVRVTAPRRLQCAGATPEANLAARHLHGLVTPVIKAPA